MLVKRILLAIISIAFGVLATLGIVYLVGTTPAEYGGAYFSLTALSLAIFLGIWLDKFMATEILPK
jgi:hypothetical protein